MRLGIGRRDDVSRACMRHHPAKPALPNATSTHLEQRGLAALHGVHALHHFLQLRKMVDVGVRDVRRAGARQAWLCALFRREGMREEPGAALWAHLGQGAHVAIGGVVLRRGQR